jgi:hypothetical protein
MITNSEEEISLILEDRSYGDITTAWCAGNVRWNNLSSQVLEEPFRTIQQPCLLTRICQDPILEHCFIAIQLLLPAVAELLIQISRYPVHRAIISDMLRLSLPNSGTSNDSSISCGAIGTDRNPKDKSITAKPLCSIWRKSAIRLDS